MQSFAPHEKGPIHCETIVKAGRLCAKGCSCPCHSTTNMRSPSWLGSSLGLLLLRYSGQPNVIKKCKEACWNRQGKNMHASYYFPRCLLARVFSISAKWGAMNGPSMSLRLMRVVPDDSLIFTYARAGNIMGMRQLFEQGNASPIDVCFSDGRSVAHVAIYAGRREIVRFLMDHNADRAYEDKHFNSVTDASWEMTFQNTPTISPFELGESTEENDFLDKRNFSAIHKIVLGISGIPLASQLQRNSVNINIHDVSGRNPPQWAATRGDVDALETLLRFGADPNDLSHAHWTSLHQAALSFEPRCLELLLRAGAAVNERTLRGDTAEHRRPHSR